MFECKDAMGTLEESDLTKGTLADKVAVDRSELALVGVATGSPVIVSLEECSVCCACIRRGRTELSDEDDGGGDGGGSDGDGGDEEEKGDAEDEEAAANEEGRRSGEAEEVEGSRRRL